MKYVDANNSRNRGVVAARASVARMPGYSDRRMARTYHTIIPANNAMPSTISRIRYAVERQHRASKAALAAKPPGYPTAVQNAPIHTMCVMRRVYSHLENSDAVPEVLRRGLTSAGEAGIFAHIAELAR